MTIKDAIKILETKRKQDDEKFNNRLDSLINDLSEYFGKSQEIDPAISDMLDNSNTSLVDVDYVWVMHLNEAFLLMKRRSECGKQLIKNNGKIDGETSQWWTTIGQGVFGIISIIFTFLFAFEVIPKESFGVLGKDGDALYYIIGTLGQQVFVLVIAIAIGIVNKYRINKKYKNADFCFEELLAEKYKDNTKLLGLLSPTAAKIHQFPSIIIASGKGAQAAGRDNFKIGKVKNSPIITGNDNSVNTDK